jgi:hypothetical protein
MQFAVVCCGIITPGNAAVSRSGLGGRALDRRTTSFFPRARFAKHPCTCEVDHNLSEPDKV